MTIVRTTAVWGALCTVIAAGLVACSSPVSQSQNNVVTVTLNDTTWNADRIQYLNIGTMYGAASYISFAAVHGGDTIEVTGLAQQGSTWSFSYPLCVLRLRRPWGVYVDSTVGHAAMDSLKCTTFSDNLIEGVITTQSGVPRLKTSKDSVKTICSFSLGY